MSVHDNDYRYSQSDRSRTLPADYEDSARSQRFDSLYYDGDQNGSRPSQQVVVIRRRAPPPVIPEGYRIVQNPTQSLVRRSPSPSASGNGQLVVRRPGPMRRTSSLDRDSFDAGVSQPREEYRRRRIIRRRADSYDSSDSESDSGSSRSRRRRPRGRGRGRGRGGKSNVSRARSSSKASKKEEHTSASEMSSSAEEKECKKIKRKEVLTGLFATVATIHAVAQVHSTMKSRDERKIAEAKGEITAAESAKMGKNAKMKQLAAVGIAAIGIKGAVDEVKEAREIHKEMRERVEARERHHEKRLQKRSKSTNR